jgi:hypothetical protein
MSNYEDFKKEIIKSLEKRFPDCVIEEIKKEKINTTLEGLCIKKKGVQNSITPIVYVDYMYEAYMNGAQVEDIVEGVYNSVNNEVVIKSIKKDFFNEENLLNNIRNNAILCLVNREQNKKRLSDWVNRDFLDLSIIYRLVIKMDNGGMQNTIITQRMIEHCGITEKELFECAVNNTKRLLPSNISTMKEVLCKTLFEGEDFPDEIEEDFMGIMPYISEGYDMYVITNKANIYGATAMLFEEVFFELAEKLDSNLYILPSSVHDVIAISDTSEACNGADSLAQIVYEINNEHVSVNERLSNQVYYYDRDLREVSLATDTPNKAIV